DNVLTYILLEKKFKEHNVYYETLGEGIKIEENRALAIRGEEDKLSLLKAIVLITDSFFIEREFYLTIIKIDAELDPNLELIEEFNKLNLITYSAGDNKDNVNGNITLLTSFKDNKITWQSLDEAISINGNQGVITKGESNTLVNLIAKLEVDDKVIAIREFTLTVIKKDEENPINYDEILAKITLPSETKTDLLLPTVIDNVNITWVSNDSAISNAGVVTRGRDDISVTLSATAGSVTKTFLVVVLKEEAIISTKTPIAEVREMALGKQVEVHGVVTSLMANGNFTIQDSSGAIPLYFGSNNNTALEIGTEYIVSGLTHNFNGLIQLNTVSVIEKIGKTSLPSVIDLTGYSLDYDDVTLYEAYVISYKNLEVISVETKKNAIELTVKNEAGEQTNARLDTRVNDLPYAFSNVEVGQIVDLYNVTIGQYDNKAQFLYTRRSEIHIRPKDPTQIVFYGVVNKLHTLGDPAPNYSAGITAKNGLGDDFTSQIVVDSSLVDLDTVGVYEVHIYLSSDESVKISYEITVRKPAQPGDYTGYYQSLAGLPESALENELKRLIVNTGFATGTTNQVKEVDKWNGSYYLIYTGMGPYGNREHTWPDSLLGSEKYDLHNLRAAKVKVNSERSNHPFTENNKPYTGSNPYELLDSGWYPGDEHIGDVARIVLYISIRYNLPLSRVGNLNMFLKWHELDPVNEFEKTRNDRIYTIQKNRNPFIDHPELVEIYFGAPKTSYAISNTLINAALQMNNKPYIIQTRSNHNYIN
ncbi:MAG TPA: hypothetical protein GX003_03205, partial [Acholeplasmataceae bacterium]|nr:hypothetical protein [Acholeplasmataceae bacterium]